MNGTATSPKNGLIGTRLGKEQGTWPTKMVVSMWYKNEASMVTTDCKINGQNVKARLEVSSQQKPLAKAAALFVKGFKEMKGDESK